MDNNRIQISREENKRKIEGGRTSEKKREGNIGREQQKSSCKQHKHKETTRGKHN